MIASTREAVEQHGISGQAEPLPRFSVTASADLVGRTRRVVRERAQQVRRQRSHASSLWLPMGLCAGFVVILCTAIWSLLDQYELSPTGIPDASSQLLIVLLWFLPVSAAIVAVALSRKNHRNDRETQE